VKNLQHGITGIPQDPRRGDHLPRTILGIILFLKLIVHIPQDLHLVLTTSGQETISDLETRTELHEGITYHEEPILKYSPDTDKVDNLLYVGSVIRVVI